MGKHAESAPGVSSVDANQAYALMQAVRVLNRLEEVRLGAAEQPVRRDDVRGMAFVRQHAAMPYGE